MWLVEFFEFHSHENVRTQTLIHSRLRLRSLHQVERRKNCSVSGVSNQYSPFTHLSHNKSVIISHFGWKLHITWVNSSECQNYFNLYEDLESNAFLSVFEWISHMKCNGNFAWCYILPEIHNSNNENSLSLSIFMSCSFAC